ncbi:hypothetical protein TNCT_152721 [Trichonephila clavata]|uniref:Uncharacterized protein n=1 Tax=Trichonephila clavata TaxID=2740835 RepID=A0A8X6FF25_TRICU|nr:hypothetical protein TNCT_152721 [Trichonephila clavata]
MPKRLVANTSEPYVSCIVLGSCRPLKNVDPFWKVFLMEHAPNLETGAWSLSKSRWPRLRNGAENSRRKRSDPWTSKRKVSRNVLLETQSLKPIQQNFVIS